MNKSQQSKDSLFFCETCFISYATISITIMYNSINLYLNIRQKSNHDKEVDDLKLSINFLELQDKYIKEQLIARNLLPPFIFL